MAKQTKKPIFTNKETGNFVSFALALKKVHMRLIKEGYKIKNGKIIPPSDPKPPHHT